MPISTPTQITVPFATTGLKNPIPAASDPVTGHAGYDAGFPATNMTPKEAGGIPPFGQDFNGILFDITTAIQYLEAGMQFPYSSSFATAVGGYPSGAIVTRTDGTGFWRNTVPNNTTNPETFGAGWQPEGSGISTIAMSNANVTLTALQAARSIIIITGTLTASLNLVFPTYQKQWLIVNNATGAFSVTCKTASGSGVSVATGLSQSIYGDGTNIGSASATQTQQSIVGARSNLRLSTTGLSALVSISADEICLEGTPGSYLTVRAVSITTLSLAGLGANGLDTGVSSASTWYSVWVISNGTTTSGLLSLQATSPVMPSGYTYKARVGWIRSDNTANKYPLSIIQLGCDVRYKLAAGTNVTAIPSLTSGAYGTYGTSLAVASLANVVPATATRVAITCGSATTTTVGVLIAPNSAYTASLGTTATPPIGTSGSNALQVFSGEILLESNNVYVAAQAQTYSSVLGWSDSI